MLAIRIEIFEDGLVKESLRGNGNFDTKIYDAQTLAMYLKEGLIGVSREVLKEEQGKGFDKNPVTTVDGRNTKDLEQVKPFGRIEFTARIAAEDFLVPVYEALIERSRVDTGTYVEAHYVYADKVLVAKNLEAFKTWTKSEASANSKIIQFINVMPYAGKLERLGITNTGGKVRIAKARDKRQRSGTHVRQPNGTYFIVARNIKKRFKNNASIRFEWVYGGNVDLSSAPTHTKSGKPLRRDFHPHSGRKGKYVYPTITIRLDKGGIL